MRRTSGLRVSPWVQHSCSTRGGRTPCATTRPRPRTLTHLTCWRLWDVLRTFAPVENNSKRLHIPLPQFIRQLEAAWGKNRQRSLPGRGQGHCFAESRCRHGKVQAFGLCAPGHWLFPARRALHLRCVASRQFAFSKGNLGLPRSKCLPFSQPEASLYSLRLQHFSVGRHAGRPGKVQRLSRTRLLVHFPICFPRSYHSARIGRQLEPAWLRLRG
jgi:hypothetical protein